MKRSYSVIAALLAVVAAFALCVGCTDKDSETPLKVEMTIECLSLVDTPEAVAEEFKALVPSDGYLLAKTSLKAKKDETVHDFLLRIAKDKKIAVVSQDSQYGGKYISSIGNISDTSTTSAYWGGWTFTVNGETPKDGETWLSIDQVVLQEGDVVLLSYSIGLAGQW